MLHRIFTSFSLFSICLCLCCTFILTACENADTAVSDLQDLVDELENFAPDYNAATWKESLEEYQTILEKLSSYTYNDEDKALIADLNAECVAYYVQYHQLEALKKTLASLSPKKQFRNTAVMPVLTDSALHHLPALPLP